MKRAHPSSSVAATAAASGQLTLAHEHALSLSLALQCAGLVHETEQQQEERARRDLDAGTSTAGDYGRGHSDWMASCGVTSCRVVSPGMVEVWLSRGTRRTPESYAAVNPGKPAPETCF